MKKKKAAPSKASNQNQVNNGLENVIMNRMPWSEGGPSQLSQVDTLFKNNRNYLISNQRYLLSQLYIEHGIIETVIDVPVEDAMRGGFDIKTKQLSEEEIQKLKDTIEENADLAVIKQAEKWKRLFGGAGIICITDQEADKPINLKRINEETPLSFRAADMWELNMDQIMGEDQYTDAEEKERLDDLRSTYRYYTMAIHKSRVIAIKGKEAPSMVRNRLRGWGLSEVESVVRSINQYLKATDLSFEVLDEFKLDIYKIAGLISALGSPQGEEIIHRRLALANSQKNYQNGIAMDATDDYVQKQLSFAGLAEVMSGIRMQIASDLRMPLTKLFGVSSAGFNSGEDDIENYNSMIESSLRPDMKRVTLKVLKLRCQQLFGIIPTDLSIEFKPLRIMSSKDEQEVKTSKFNRLIQARQANELTSQEFREMANKDEIFPIKLDPSVDIDSMKAEIAAQAMSNFPAQGEDEEELPDE